MWMRVRVRMWMRLRIRNFDVDRYRLQQYGVIPSLLRSRSCDVDGDGFQEDGVVIAGHAESHLRTPRACLFLDNEWWNHPSC